ncbi:hypothetical protein Tdes44962_MAKER10508 [Teratosphaeria destructans]|uniref:Uncharacterized protein n=1 Tax=Teratosphaeria destructans TaxID=418781 RepID=A0A9W7SZN3_9PEZI|nr:hypothetical protein Tdes44962_MAKER10508 [Teratosphaeria destructans]
MSGFMPPREETVGGWGGRRAAVVLPRGWDEAVMWERVVAAVSLCMRGGGRAGVGVAMGSSGVGGGEGLWRGSGGSSGDDMAGREGGRGRGRGRWGLLFTGVDGGRAGGGHVACD